MKEIQLYIMLYFMKISVIPDDENLKIRKKLVELLLHANINTILRDKKGFTALDYAKMDNSNNIAELIENYKKN